MNVSGCMKRNKNKCDLIILLLVLAWSWGLVIFPGAGDGAGGISFVLGHRVLSNMKRYLKRLKAKRPN